MWSVCAPLAVHHYHSFNDVVCLRALGLLSNTTNPLVIWFVCERSVSITTTSLVMWSVCEPSRVHHYHSFSDAVRLRAFGFHYYCSLIDMVCLRAVRLITTMPYGMWLVCERSACQPSLPSPRGLVCLRTLDLLSTNTTSLVMWCVCEPSAFLRHENEPTAAPRVFRIWDVSGN